MNGYEREWLTVRQILESIVCGGPWCSGPGDAQYQLYFAVLDGKVRVRIAGKVVDDVSWIAGRRWHDTVRWALPADMELNAEDARQIWNWDMYDLADVIALGRITPVMAGMRIETILLNMEHLVARLVARLPDRSLSLAQKDVDFDSKWTKLRRNFGLLLGVEGMPVGWKVNLLLQWGAVNDSKRLAFAMPGRKKSMGGRASGWDWLDVESHILDLFGHNGALSKDDPTWASQVHVENAIKRYCQKTTGREPSTSVARERAKQFMAEAERIRAANIVQPISD